MPSRDVGDPDALYTWLWPKKPEFQNGLPWYVETWAKTCGLPLLFNFEPHPPEYCLVHGGFP